jgi:hypothetical protein
LQQERIQKPRFQATQDEGVPPQTRAARHESLLADLDELLDDFDDIITENEDMLTGFVQRNGE